MSIRCFVALNYSVAVTRRIAEEVERHKPTVGAGHKVVWVPPANLHVTLQFLGSIADDLVDGVATRLKPVGARHAPFSLKAHGFGAFPSAEKPRVLWVGADGGEALVKLQRDVEAAMHGLGLPKDDRPFHPHVTVARVKELAAETALSWSSDADLGMSQASEIVVYESRTLAKGSEYIARARVALGKKEI